ncbi:MAG: carboxypeptidase-like regulatory domain-containing protein [Gammaproteobacteria bacterium]|nr:carboxypeptidase-like regulatory domain-containing protein [Gammaproteobacteria bacterium]
MFLIEKLLVKQEGNLRSFLRRFGYAIYLTGISAAPLVASAQQQNDNHAIEGQVQSSNGEEAGVWVIAETDDLPTHFIKIVVTDDEGRFLLPDLPDALYKVWVRGYGLVDSRPVSLRVGADITLKTFVAESAAEAAQIYPANYWYSLLEVPDANEFPGTGDAGNGISEGMRNQAQWIDMTKQGCQLCHQLGNKLTRSIDHLDHLGFESSTEAWHYRTAIGIRGPFMSAFAGRFGRDRGMGMYADWTDRIAAGETPAAPDRPSGIERNVVVTLWDWGNESSYIHDEITTDKRNPMLNAGGKVYGVDGGHGTLLELDTETNEFRTIEIAVKDNADNPAVTRFAQEFPVPSIFYGDEALWEGPADPHNPMFDELGRIWMTTKVRGNILPEWCQQGSSNKYAQYYPTRSSSRQASYYDPATELFGLIDTCFGTHHLQFAGDEDRNLYFSGGGDVLGWINTRLFDRTGDEQLSQGWCPMVVDTNGDGRISKPWNEPVGRLRNTSEGGGGEQLVDFDPRLDTRMSPGSYGIIVNQVDNVAWGGGTEFPGRIYRFDKGSNPPETCITEVYEVPIIDGEYEGFGPRGIDVDNNGVVWTALSGSSHLASFDRSKCSVLNGPTTIDSQHCQEGWTLYEVPGPTLKGTDVKADFHYYNWVDNFNTLGLGENIPIANGSGSDSLQVLNPATEEWVTMRVPYPLGFYSRGLDGRIDDPNAGWKGRGVWANYGTNFNWHTEGGKGATSKMVKFQIRPDPLAN